jgi:hypothetical protein
MPPSFTYKLTACNPQIFADLRLFRLDSVLVTLSRAKYFIETGDLRFMQIFSCKKNTGIGVNRKKERTFLFSFTKLGFRRGPETGVARRYILIYYNPPIHPHFWYILKVLEWKISLSFMKISYRYLVVICFVS